MLVSTPPQFSFIHHTLVTSSTTCLGTLRWSCWCPFDFSWISSIPTSWSFGRLPGTGVDSWNWLFQNSPISRDPGIFLGGSQAIPTELFGFELSLILLDRSYVPPYGAKGCFCLSNGQSMLADGWDTRHVGHKIPTMRFYWIQIWRDMNRSGHLGLWPGKMICWTFSFDT